jgi:hypothetical protein
MTAIIFQQAGWWPLDQLLVYGMIGLFGLIGILICILGRTRVTIIVLIIPILIAVAALAYGAIGLSDVNEKGFISGGCTVTASTPLDATTVTDTTKRNPFDIDPNGPLTWNATSPIVFKDHIWFIDVQVANGSITVADNFGNPDPNTDDKTENGDTIPNVAGYVAEVTQFNGDEVRGVFVVSGEITGGGTCSGLAFVRLVDDPFASLLSKIAAGLAILIIIILIIIFFRRSYMTDTQVDSMDDVDEAVNEAVEGYEPGVEDLPSTDDLA